MMVMTPRLTHFAINTDDVEQTRSFYESVFGWSCREYGPPGFVQIMDETGQNPMGAIQQRRQLLPDEPTRGFECTFGVDDVDEVGERIVAAGGKILMASPTWVTSLPSRTRAATRRWPWSTTPRPNSPGFRCEPPRMNLNV